MKSKLNEGGDVASHESSLITLRELAFLLRKSRSAVHKAWPSWAKKFGLNPIRFGGSKKGRLLFNREQVDEMLKKWMVSNTELFDSKDAGGKPSISKRKQKSK